MSYPVYPWGLPYPTLGGSLRNRSRTLRSRMAGGRSRMRQLYTAQESEKTLTFTFSQTEYDGFVGWMFYSLKGIQNYFECPVLREDGTHTEIVRFIEEPDEQELPGGQFRISAPVEMKRDVRISDSQSAISAFGEAELMQTYENLKSSLNRYAES